MVQKNLSKWTVTLYVIPTHFVKYPRIMPRRCQDPALGWHMVVGGRWGAHRGDRWAGGHHAVLEMRVSPAPLGRVVGT